MEGSRTRVKKTKDEPGETDGVKKEILFKKFRELS